MKFIKKILHWFSHKMQTNTGKVVSWRNKDLIHIGFKCDICGEIDSKSIVVYKDDVFNDNYKEKV